MTQPIHNAHALPNGEELLAAMRHSPRRAILFDMDGVLTDSEPYMIEATRRFFREKFGVDPAPSDFFEFFGAGEHPFFGGVAAKHGLELDFEPDRLRIYHLYREAIDAPVPDLHCDGMTAGPLAALPGAREVVALATEAGLRQAVATSASLLKAEITLLRIGLPSEVFDIVITADDITRNKPEPEIFLRAAERLGVEPRECLVVEDSLNGVRAGRAAGMAVVAIATAGVSEADLRAAGAAFVVPDLAALPPESFE